MTNSLAIEEVVDRWNLEHKKGADKKFPSLDLVRLEKWFFKGKTGRLLEYGFGSGLNLIYLLECGHEVDAIDVSREAKLLVEGKLEKRPDIRPRATLKLLDKNASTLPYDDETFDYVNCVSVLSLLGSRENVQRLLKEFRRITKPGAKLILDINGPRSDFAAKGKLLKDDIYEYRGSLQDHPVPCYCPSDEDKFVDLVKPFFSIEDVGFVAHKYMGSEISEFVICAKKES